METFSSHRAFVGWNGDPEPFFMAAEAAIDAGPFEPSRQDITLTWEDRVGHYKYIEEARARLRHGPLPTTAEIEVGQLAEGGLPTDTSPARLHVQTLFGVVTIIGAGQEWEKASRAYQAAIAAYERLVSKPEPQPAPAPAVAAPAPASSFTKPQRSPLRTWLNDNQGVLTAIGVALAVVAIVVTVVVA